MVPAMSEPLALFEADGPYLIPTDAAPGPWRPDALHGGAVSALFGHTFEEAGWSLGRMTVDLLRRVPMEPLKLVVGPTSTTRRLMRKSAELWAGDRPVAKGEALLLPATHLDLPPQPERPLVVPKDLERMDASRRSTIVERVGFPSFVSHAVSTRTVRTDETHPGDFAYWIDLLLPAVAGHDITPVQRVCAAADYTNGGFPTLPYEEWSFVTLDLTVQLVRPPVGDWVGVTNDSAAGASGIGLGDAELHDVHGRIGRATATLLVERR
jgi:hypothetical protein